MLQNESYYIIMQGSFEWIVCCLCIAMPVYTNNFNGNTIIHGFGCSIY